jgi:hypothetical protein
VEGETSETNARTAAKRKLSRPTLPFRSSRQYPPKAGRLQRLRRNYRLGRLAAPDLDGLSFRLAYGPRGCPCARSHSTCFRSAVTGADSVHESYPYSRGGSGQAGRPNGDRAVGLSTARDVGPMGLRRSADPYRFRPSLADRLAKNLQVVCVIRLVDHVSAGCAHWATPIPASSRAKSSDRISKAQGDLRPVTLIAERADAALARSVRGPGVLSLRPKIDAEPVCSDAPALP